MVNYKMFDLVAPKSDESLDGLLTGEYVSGYRNNDEGRRLLTIGCFLPKNRKRSNGSSNQARVHLIGDYTLVSDSEVSENEELSERYLDNLSYRVATFKKRSLRKQPVISFSIDDIENPLVIYRDLSFIGDSSLLFFGSDYWSIKLEFMTRKLKQVNFDDKMEGDSFRTDIESNLDRIMTNSSDPDNLFTIIDSARFFVRSFERYKHLFIEDI